MAVVGACFGTNVRKEVSIMSNMQFGISTCGALESRDASFRDFANAGASYVEISEIMDRSIKSIDNALQRIKKKLIDLNKQ